MKRSVILIIAGAATTVAAMFIIAAPDTDPPVRTDGDAAVLAFDPDSSIEDRIATLERALSDERQARQLLQEEVLVLTSEIERLTTGGPFSGRQEITTEEESIDSAAPAQTARERRARRNDPEVRMERFVAAGFTAGEAEWIMQRESELQMEALQARYDARRSGEPLDFFGNRNLANSALRDELGDGGYERYLEANGRPTRVSVNSVIDGSPALTAGLQPGDQIVNYDGRRVFSMDEIVSLTMEGEAGQNVVVDIQRDGIPMQVSLPRGPLGITGGRRFRR